MPVDATAPDITHYKCEEYMCGQQNVSTENGTTGPPYLEHGYNNNCVRDLAWAIFSPPMVAQIDTAWGSVHAPAFALTRDRQHWLAALDADPSPLQSFLATSQSHFLGVYFEALWRFFLLQDNEVTLLASNRQVIDDGRTAGEFDMFYRCHHRNATVHLELAVKFYLGLPVHADTDLHQAQFWLGPNCVDRLDLKIGHLRDHQLPLINHPGAQDWLQKEKLLPAIQEVALHGYLFYPSSADGCMPDNAPDNASHQHLRSHWLRVDQLSNLQSADAKQKHYRIVPRLQWLCSHYVADGQWQTYAHFAEKVHRELDSALMQPVLCEETAAGSALAQRRFFVAPPDWPALHWPRKKF